MKKTTLLLFLVLTSFGFSQQNWTTGTINLASNFSVKFDTNSTTTQVTLIGPNNVGFAVSPTNDAYNDATQSGMGLFAGDDVIFYSNNTITDRQQTGFNQQPGLDTTINNWNVISDNNNLPSAGLRTVVATRARSTGDANDFIFPVSASSFTVIWAIGGNNSFTFHTNRGGTVGNVVLSNDDFQINPVRFTISPNPSRNDLNVGITYNPSRDYNIEVYDVLGKQIYRGQLIKDDTTINATSWKAGVYLVKLSSNEFTQTKRFMKQ